MEEIKAPKKERKFLRAIGDIALTLARELVLGIGKKLINKVGNKRQGLVIAFALVAAISYAAIDSIPYPVTGNKQRLGFQTTGNGLVYRGRAADTITKPSLYVDKNVKAYLLLDSVRGTIFVWRQTRWDSILVGGGVATPFDTSSLNLVNRFAEKLNIADTSILNLQSRFNLKLNISDTAAMLLPYATKSYVDTAGRFYARQDYLNVTSSTLTWTQTDTLVPSGVNVIMVYRNGQILLTTQYTIPNKTTVVIAATSFKVGENYTVIFPKGGGGSGGGGGGGGGSGSVTSISQGTGIIATPNPIVSTGSIAADTSFLVTRFDTLSMLLPYLRKLDTASLSTRIDAKGTVTSIAMGYGILSTQSPLTTSGTMRVDSATVYDFVRDSIVAVEIGGDTIKIIKQEYNNVTSDTLTFTILPKFPIQLRQFILLFRNGQLLLNDQFTVIDTNQVKIAASSFKLGENYTLVTVSGIGSVSSGQGNPVYPEPGIAVSTGTTWTTSVVNNSTNWNTAYTDRYKWDGGSTDLVPATGRTSLGGTIIGQSMFTLTNPSAITFPRFNVDNTVTALSDVNFRTAIGAGTGNGNGTVTSVTAAATAGNPLSITNTTTTPIIELLSATTGRNGYLTSTDWTTFNNKFSDTSLLNLTSRFAAKLNISDTASMLTNYNSRINLKLNISDTALMLTPYLKRADTTLLNLTSRFAAKLNISDTASMLTNYNSRINLKLNISDTALMLTPYLKRADTTLLNLTSRFAAKQNNITLTTTGTSGAATLVGATLNIPQYTAGGGGTGTVTSVAMSVPSFLSVSGSPITTSGTLAVSLSGNALPVLNGGTGATTAANARIVLGGTTSGISLFTLTNSVSDKFIKVNSNNTITLLNANDTRIAIGAGTGSVTSVGMTVPTFLSVSGSPISTSGSFGVTLSGSPLPVLNGGTGAAIALDARDNLGAACKSCNETLTGNKTFTGRINMQTLERTYVNTTSTSITVDANTTWLNIHQDANVTITLPSAATYPGRELIIKQTGTGFVSSASTNIIGFTVSYLGSPQTIIINASLWKFVTLVSNGTYWITMQRNN